MLNVKLIALHEELLTLNVLSSSVLPVWGCSWLRCYLVLHAQDKTQTACAAWKPLPAARFLSDEVFGSGFPWGDVLELPFLSCVGRGPLVASVSLYRGLEKPGRLKKNPVVSPPSQNLIILLMREACVFSR